MFYAGCIGPSYSCGSKIELFPDDSLTLETETDTFYPNNYWRDRVIIVRQTRESYDVCTGCWMDVQFVNASSPFNMKVTLMEANYTTDSFLSSETLYLKPLVSKLPTLTTQYYTHCNM